jgi:hypothetical protein
MASLSSLESVEIKASLLLQDLQTGKAEIGQCEVPFCLNQTKQIVWDICWVFDLRAQFAANYYYLIPMSAALQKRRKE